MRSIVPSDRAGEMAIWDTDSPPGGRDGSGIRNPDAHHVLSPVVPLEIRNGNSGDGGSVARGARGHLNRAADAVDLRFALRERNAGGDGDLVEPDGLVGLLEAEDERTALDRDAAAHRVDPGIGPRPAGRHLQAQRELVAGTPRRANSQ